MPLVYSMLGGTPFAQPPRTCRGQARLTCASRPAGIHARSGCTNKQHLVTRCDQPATAAAALVYSFQLPATLVRKAFRQFLVLVGEAVGSGCGAGCDSGYGGEQRLLCTNILCKHLLQTVLLRLGAMPVAGWRPSWWHVHPGTQQPNAPHPVCSWGHRHHLHVIYAGALGGARVTGATDGPAGNSPHTCSSADVLRCAACSVSQPKPLSCVPPHE